MSSIEFADGKPLTEDEIHAAARTELRTNKYYQDDDLRDNWSNAYGYYKGALPLPDDTHSSDIVSTDVSDTLEWILPAILKPLVESPDVVRFDPVNPEDQAQADLESDYVHHTFMKKCNGFLKLYVHIKDALLLKNGVFCTYWDEGVKNQLEEYKNLTEVELADLLAPADTSTVKLISSESREVPILDVLTGEPLPPPPPEPPQMDPQTGQPAGPPPPPQPAPVEMIYDVTVRRFTPQGKPKVENCNPESFWVKMTHDSVDLTDARACAYSEVITRAELLAYGYDEDVVAEAPSGSGSGQYWDNEVRWAREDVEREANSMDQDRNDTGDPSQDPIDLHRVYLMLDADGDGYEERYLVILAGGNGEVLLDQYEVPENPFDASTPFIAGHKFYGYSLFDKVRQLADHKTAVLRMIEDNLELVNNPRKKVVRGQANLDDLLTYQPGGIWRVEQPDAVTEIPTPPLDQSAYQMLDYYDKMRSERTGIDPNAQSISGIMPEESMNSAVERVLSAKEELVGLIVRVFAETGVKGMFLKLRGLMMRNNPREELVQLRNKWTTINPGNWIERTNSSVVVGLGTGDRIKKQNGLMQVFGMQKEALQMGLQGIVVTPERMNFTVSEFIRASGLGDPDDYWIDPALLSQDPRNAQTPRGQEMIRAMQLQEQQAQQAQQEQQAAQQAQQEQQQQLLDLQLKVAAMQQQGKLEEAKIKAESQTQDRHSDMQQFMAQMKLDWATLVADVQAEKAKIAANTATTLLQQGAQVEQAKEAAKQMTKKESKTDATK